MTDVGARTASGERRRLGGLSSLAAAIVVVLGVLAFVFVAYGGGAGTAGRGAASSVVSPVERPADPYVSADRLEDPVVCEAEIDVKGWRDREQRIVEARIESVVPLGEPAQTDPLEGEVPPARRIAEKIAGARALLSVEARVAKDLPESGPAHVRLVVLPRGEAASLLVDAVLPRQDLGGGDAVAPVDGPVDAIAPVAGWVEPSAATGQPQAPVGPAAVAGLPTVQGLSTSAAAPGSQVTITGHGFGDQMRDSWVTCAGARAPVVSWSDTSVVFTVPSSATRGGYVGVVVGGVTSNGIYFLPYTPPRLDSISPGGGAVGTVVTFRGSGFGASQGSGWVTFAGVAGQVISWTDTQIQAVVPKDALAGYAGVVANGLTSNGIFYAPYGAPVVDGVTKTRFTTGDAVVITGRNFGSSAGSVVVGGVRITADEWTASQVTFTVPDDLRSGYVGVITARGWTSNGVWGNVVPRLKGLSSWWASPGTQLTISGVGFGSAPNGYRVTVGGVEAPVASWSTSTIVVTVPVGARSGYVGVGTPTACSNGRYLVVETRARLEDVSPRAVSPGETIVLTGSDFGEESASSHVLVGGTWRCEVVEWAPGRIVCRLPADVGSGYVGVVKQGVTSNGIWISVSP